jgi:hypothetical protein
MAAAQLPVPAQTTRGPAAGSVVSTLQRAPEQQERPTISRELLLQAVGRCWGA